VIARRRRELIAALDGGCGVAAPGARKHREAIMRKVLNKEEMALLKEAGEMFNETGCVPGNDGEQVPAERMVPQAKEYISESIDETPRASW
jgi:hypothetical protein